MRNVDKLRGSGKKLLDADDAKAAGLSRREYLAIAGALGTTALAGCSGDDSKDAGDGDNSDDTGSDDSEETGNGDGEETDTTEEQISKGGSLRVSIDSTLGNLMGTTAVAPHDMAIAYLNADYLFHVNHDLAIEGGLVRNLEMSDDGKTWTMTLPKNAMFHPPHKRALTAEDVVWNFDLVAGNTDIDIFTPRFKPWMKAANWSAPDENTFEISFPDKPQAGVDSWLAAWHGFPIYSPDAIKDGMDMTTQPVATGPFKFEEWVTGDHLTLTAFEDYWHEDHPYVDEVVVKPITDGSAKVTALQQNNIDIVRNPPVEQLSTLESNGDVTVERVNSYAFTTLDINPTKETKENRGEGFPTTHKEIRVAISEAIDRNAMAEIIWAGNAVPAQNYFPDGSYWHVDHNPHAMGANPERARELISEAGFDSPEVNLISTAGRADFRKLGRIARDNLKNAGFNVNLQELEPGTWSDRLWNGKFDISVDDFSGSPDMLALRGFWHYEEKNPPFFNYNYANAEEIYSKWDSAQHITNREERKSVLDEVQRMIIDDPIRCVCARPQMIHAYRNSVRNYSTHPWETNFDLQWAWLDR